MLACFLTAVFAAQQIHDYQSQSSPLPSAAVKDVMRRKLTDRLPWRRRKKFHMHACRSGGLPGGMGGGLTVEGCLSEGQEPIISNVKVCALFGAKKAPCLITGDGLQLNRKVAEHSIKCRILLCSLLLCHLNEQQCWQHFGFVLCIDLYR